MKKSIMVFSTIAIFVLITFNISVIQKNDQSNDTKLKSLFQLTIAHGEGTDGYTMENYAWGCRCEPTGGTCEVSDQCQCNWGSCGCC